jgi:hypothetical protein
MVEGLVIGGSREALEAAPASVPAHDDTPASHPVVIIRGVARRHGERRHAMLAPPVNAE